MREFGRFGLSLSDGVMEYEFLSLFPYSSAGYGHILIDFTKKQIIFVFHFTFLLSRKAATLVMTVIAPALIDSCGFLGSQIHVPARSAAYT